MTPDSPLTSPQPLFDRAWLQRSGAACDIERAIQAGLLGDRNDPTVRLLWAMALDALDRPQEAIENLTDGIADQPEEYRCAAFKAAAALCMKIGNWPGMSWCAQNAAIAEANRGAIAAAIEIVEAVYFSYPVDQELSALLCELIDLRKPDLSAQIASLSLDGDRVAVQAAFLQGEPVEASEQLWNRVEQAGLGSLAAESFHRSVRARLGRDARRPDRLCAWFILLEPALPPHLAGDLDSIMAWYAAQPPSRRADLHYALNESWLHLQTMAGDRPIAPRQPPRTVDDGALLRIGVVDLPLTQTPSPAFAGLALLPLDRFALFHYAPSSFEKPAWPALAGHCTLNRLDLLERMAADRLDVLLIAHSAPAESVWPILAQRPAHRLVSWFAEPAGFGPGLLDAALVHAKNSDAAAYRVEPESVIPAPPLTPESDPEAVALFIEAFARAMRRILAL